MRLPFVGAALALLLGACQPAPPSVEGAWIRLPAVQGRPGAAYFMLNGGEAGAMLVSVKTPAAVRTELHESMKGHGGVMTMVPLKQVDVAAKGTISFAPGGKHVMLYDISPALKAGATAKLTLALVDGKTLETDAKVIGAGDPPPQP